MNPITRLAVVALLPLFPAFGQAPFKALPTPLNHPLLNSWLPYISYDGVTVLFLSDNTEGKVPKLFLSTRSGGDWKDPVELPKGMNSNTNFRNGFSLSPDGRTVYISSSRPGTLGGYDLYGFSISGTGGDNGINLGNIINSKENEASLVMTPDGNTAYFMRCASMNATSCSGCRILTTTKKSGNWGPPVELPATVNAGNSMFPRILADGNTLLFASNVHQPLTGGIDLYMTTRSETGWSNPVALEFLNTDGDEAQVSVQSSARNATTSVTVNGRMQLADIPFPPSTRPTPVMRIVGTVSGQEKPESFYVSVVDGSTGKPVATTKADATGSFSIFLAGGKRHLLFIDPAEDNGGFFLKTYDLRSGSVQTREVLRAEVPDIGPALAVDCSGISITDNRPDQASMAILTRVMRMMRNNPSVIFELAAGPDAPADSTGTQNSPDQLSASIMKFLRDRGVPNEIRSVRTDGPAGGLVLRVGGN